MDSLAQVDVIYTDYSKCFDRIDHVTLMHKLSLAGIHGDLYRWFCSYIENRSQAVVLQGFTSFWVTIPSGVPQGSLLGPLLFVLFINDIGTCFQKSKILLFADDMKVLKLVRRVSDVIDLQADLTRFESYCEINKLDLNVSKCFYMVFSRKNSIIDQGYVLRNQRLLRVNEIRDLGVIHDNKLLFDKHVANIVKKASQALGFIMRTATDFRSLKSIKVLYCAFVRSHLEYASQVWNPQYAIYKSRIERIQKRFLRYLDYKARLQSDNYEHRCKRYHFLPLEVRRTVSDICYVLMVANGKVDTPELLAKIGLRSNCAGLRTRPLLNVPRVRTNFRQNTFTIRAIESFNNAPVNLDLFCTGPAVAKRLITAHHFSLKPNCLT